MFDDIELKWAYTGLLIFLVAVIIWLLTGRGSQPIAIQAPGIDMSHTATRDCSTIVRECSNHAELKVECDRLKARRDMNIKLSNPYNDGECHDQLVKLDESCPEGCHVDYSKMITVPGKLSFAFNSKADESGMCQARGSLAMTITGRCIAD